MATVFSGCWYGAASTARLQTREGDTCASVILHLPSNYFMVGPIAEGVIGIRIPLIHYQTAKMYVESASASGVAFCRRILSEHVFGSR